MILLSGALALPALPVHADAKSYLFVATLVGTACEVKAALAAGADPGARDDNDKTPLHKAARNNANPAVIAALIEAGADPGARDAYDNTPLHDAASDNSNPAVIVALIEGGADPNARDKYNEMPLHVAAHNAMFAGLSGAEPVAAEDANRWPSVIKALIEGGADPGARNERGATPFDFATDVLFNAAASGTASEVKAALAAGANPAARDAYDNTPLHLAASDNSNPSVIAALIEAGADTGARRGNVGFTPLHLAAAENANPSVIVALIEGGADPGAWDDDGFTPFDYAKDNDVLKGTDAYWLLNEARFE